MTATLWEIVSVGMAVGTVVLLMRVRTLRTQGIFHIRRKLRGASGLTGASVATLAGDHG